MRTPKEYAFIFLKGMGMGAAEVIPGVSGGTIAFITGVYEELITSIKSVDITAVKQLFSGDFLSFWKQINGRFLAVLLAGDILSILAFANLVGALLKTHPIQIWSFFFGLILISSIVVCRDIQKWTTAVVSCLILGVAIAVLITEAMPSESPNNIFTIFFSGAIAISAMILPGISGSFILLILGKYEFIIRSLTEFDFKVIILFASGCLLGLMAFSRLISWLFKKFREITIAILAGFMIGSLNKVWPWKETLETFVDRHGETKPLIQDNVLPTTFQSMGHEPYLWQAILFFVLGVGIVVALERLAIHFKNG